MPEIQMTPQQLQDLLAAAVKQATAMNPLEQKKFDEDMAREKRRNLMAVELGRAEEEAMHRKRNGCSHMRDARTGDGVARGATNGEWTTGGQAYQNGLAMIICTRCSTAWMFKPEPEYYNFIIQNGLRGAQPPSDSLTICTGCFELKPSCKCKEIAKEHAAAHPLAN
jgi:hypothetical protein